MVVAALLVRIFVWRVLGVGLPVLVVPLVSVLQIIIVLAADRGSCAYIAF